PTIEEDGYCRSRENSSIEEEENTIDIIRDIEAR
ncbi:MAG: hypothetical protein EZS28_046670, partial [Streblomastix strix]